MKTLVDFSSWERRDTFSFFRDFYNAYINVTCPVDCSIAKRNAKEAGVSFFLYYLHAIAKGLNEIEELRYRIDPEGNVVIYDVINILTPIKNKTKGGYTTVLLPYTPDREAFIENSARIINSIAEDNPFGAETACPEYDVVVVSAIPNLPFTSLNCTQKHMGGSDYPLINVGMMGTDFKMPIAISVHHGFVDGEQIADFYHVIQKSLNA